MDSDLKQSSFCRFESVFSVNDSDPKGKKAENRILTLRDMDIDPDDIFIIFFLF